MEILLASMGAALVLAAFYGIFIHAIRLRDTATDRVRDARVRARAESVIRADLRTRSFPAASSRRRWRAAPNDNSGPGGSSLPGYLKFTTTTGRDNGTDLYGDVQQVEYYLDARSRRARGSGRQEGEHPGPRRHARPAFHHRARRASEEQILHGVQSLAVEFYDGSNWQQSWNYDSTAAALTSGGDTTSGTVIAFGNTTLARRRARRRATGPRDPGRATAAARGSSRAVDDAAVRRRDASASPEHRRDAHAHAVTRATPHCARNPATAAGSTGPAPGQPPPDHPRPAAAVSARAVLPPPMNRAPSSVPRPARAAAC